MTAITQNLPWFIKDLGISIVGIEEKMNRQSTRMLLEEVIALGMHEREKSSRHIVSSHDKSFKFPPEFS